MKKNYVKPSVQMLCICGSVDLCSNLIPSDSERAAHAEQKYEQFFGRRDEGYDRRSDDDNEGDGCLGTVIMFAIATFSFGAGIIHCIC